MWRNYRGIPESFYGGNHRIIFKEISGKLIKNHSEWITEEMLRYKFLKKFFKVAFFEGVPELFLRIHWNIAKEILMDLIKESLKKMFK